MPKKFRPAGDSRQLKARTLKVKSTTAMGTAEFNKKILWFNTPYQDDDDDDKFKRDLYLR
jgi:hypothetical protein